MTLEYAYQDWCLAQFAANLGKWSDYELFMRRSQNYRNVWNPENKYMQPREIDGSWCKEFKPIGSEFGFTEANGAVYTHFVPHDMQGLIGLFGGKDAYVERLNRQFMEGEKMVLNMTGIIRHGLLIQISPEQEWHICLIMLVIRG